MPPQQQTRVRRGNAGTRPTASQYRARISSSGLKRLGGKIYEEFLPELRFPQGLRVYEEMRMNSGVVGGFLRAIESSFRSVNWYTIPADESPDAIKRAAFAESARRDMERPWSSFITDMQTFLPFGFSAMEMWFKYRKGRGGDPRSRYSDGKVGFADIALVGHDSIQDWAYDDTDPNKLIGIVQVAPPTYQRIIIPREKLLLFRTRAEKDNPEGQSILRQAYYHYYAMTRLEAVENISLERTGAGIPVVKLPKNATTIAEKGAESDEQAALNLVRSVRVDEQGGVVEPDGWTFRLERPNGRVDPQLFDMPVKRHRANMLMSVLSVFLELGTSRVGSFALAEQGQGFFESAFEGYVEAFEEVYNNEAIPLLFELNGVNDDLLPQLTHTTIAGSNIEAITRAVKNLTETGHLDAADPLISNYLKRLLRFPIGDTVREIEQMIPEDEKSDEQIADERRRKLALEEEDDNGLGPDEGGYEGDATE